MNILPRCMECSQAVVGLEVSGYNHTDVNGANWFVQWVSAEFLWRAISNGFYPSTTGQVRLEGANEGAVRESIDAYANAWLRDHPAPTYSASGTKVSNPFGPAARAGMGAIFPTEESLAPTPAVSETPPSAAPAGASPEAGKKDDNAALIIGGVAIAGVLMLLARKS